MKRLAGKVCIVTGASQGLGYGISRVFAREGARLVFASRTVANLEKAANEIRKEV